MIFQLIPQGVMSGSCKFNNVFISLLSIVPN